MNAPYFLPDGYRARAKPDYFDDDSAAVDIWQPDVYSLVDALAQRSGATAIVDVGCGQAAKLVRLATTAALTGIDFGENIAACRAAYPQHRWLEADLERDLHWTDAVPQGAVVVSSDVIEHLVTPDVLLDGLTRVRDRVHAIVVSTPERIRTHGADHLGPPSNPAHVREWALPEFVALLTEAGLRPMAAGTTRSCTTRPELATIVVVIEGGASAGSSTAVPSAAWLPWPERGSFQLVSPVHDSVEQHLAAAAAVGATTVEVTDLRLLDVLEGRSAATEAATLERAPLHAVDAPTPPRIAAYNLIAAPPDMDADEVRRRGNADLPVALTGRDASSDWWPLSTVVGLRRRLAEQGDELQRALGSITELKAWIDEQERSKLALMEELRTVSATIDWHTQQADYWRNVAVDGDAPAAT